MRTSVLVLALAFCLPLGCSDTAFDPGTGGDPDIKEDPAKDLTCDEEGAQRCKANVHQGCKDGQWVTIEACADPMICSPALARCSECNPGQTICVGDDVHQCNASGQVAEKLQTCAVGQCSIGHCVDPCSQAADRRSYIGCDYWPTVTINSGLVRDFSFAVAIANTGDAPANVTISSASNAALETVTVAPDSLSTVKLPWVDELKQEQDPLFGVFSQSAQVVGGAYHLVSDQPVTVYQFNALNYQLPFDCKEGQEPLENLGDGKCYSYTNDASLLLPSSVLDNEYMVIARPTMGVKSLYGTNTTGGFMAVVATEPDRTNLQVTFAANTQAGEGGLGAFRAGQTGTFSLGQRDVLQILSEMPADCTAAAEDEAASYCDLSATTDLTGTVIKADKRVALFSGHDCTFVPFNRWACDHLEEQIFPMSTWGTRYIGAHTLSSGADPAIYRVVSAEDNNQITFTGGVHDAVTLNKGKWLEFETTKDFEAAGSGHFALVQYMVGQNYAGQTEEAAPNDPAMALAVATEQYRRSYRFLAPESYEQNYVNVIAKPGAEIMLDGTKVEGFTQVPDSEFGVAKVKIAGGAHKIEGDSEFGIAVYGVGSYTSYMYPGGLDLKILID